MFITFQNNRRRGTDLRRACLYIVSPALLLLPWFPTGLQAEDSLQVIPGAINRVIIKRNEATIAVYGLPDPHQYPSSESGQESEVDWLLLTHHRRDVLGDATSEEITADNIAAPANERQSFEQPMDFWRDFVEGRFNDMSQQSTKILVRPIAVTHWVAEGEAIGDGFDGIEVLDTPGFTSGAVSYLMTVDEQRVGFVGDLIYGDGQLLDLYSLQDAIHPAKIRGYHGYAARAAELIESVEKLEAEELDLLIPIRGPLIEEPAVALAKLKSRLRRIYHNYLSTNALYWYFKADNMRICADRVLGAGAEFELMPYAEHVPSPDWVWEFATSRLIISEDSKRGLLLDCWSQPVIDGVQALIDQGVISGLDGIFVTHYHDDHTAMVQQASERFQCPVHALAQYADVLTNPDGYHLPALTQEPIESLITVEDGQKRRWHEYELTFHFFPGQTLYHGALHAEKEGGEAILFVGDSFAPSGIDDYCLMNRNLLHDDQGYFRCLDLVRQLGEGHWIINQHIPFVFRFAADELDYLETRYRERRELLAELFPWDDVNYGVDEQWAVGYPYAQHALAGQKVATGVRVTNHSPHRREFVISLRDGREHCSGPSRQTLSIAPNQVSVATFELEVPGSVSPIVVTADIESEGMRFQAWTESMIIVTE